MNYRIIDHTADIAVEFYGRSLNELFESAANSLSQIIYQQRKPEIIDNPHSFDFQFSDEDLTVNFINFLREILFYINQYHYYFIDCEIKDFTNNKILIKCHYLKLQSIAVVNEIKAVTYHDCSIKKKKIDDAIMFVAKVTFDI